MLIKNCILSLFLLKIIIFVAGQDHQRGFINVSNSSRINVLLECESKVMSIKLLFNELLVKEFRDWIVVGSNNRHECRQQGSGELQYLIEIPLVSEPCGTIIAGLGMFENSISIKKHPFLILQGDELITVRCVYGPPEIGTAVIPSLPLSQAAQPLTSVLPPVIQSSLSPIVSTGTIYLVVFLVLFLALLFLMCGCLVFFFKRRKLRLERRKKILLAVPAGSELSKLGLQRLWWTGAGNKSAATNSNDALLSHDYMVSTNSTQERLSISTSEYPGDSPASSSNGGASSSPGEFAASNQHQALVQFGINQQQTNFNAAHHQPERIHQHNHRELYVHESKHMVPKPRLTSIPAVVVRAPGVLRSLQSIPEERTTSELWAIPKHMASAVSPKMSQPEDQLQNVAVGFENLNLNLSNVYGQTVAESSSTIIPRSATPNPVSSCLKAVTVDTKVDLDYVNYSLPRNKSTPGDNKNIKTALSSSDEDAESMSTLEGRQYYPLNMSNSVVGKEDQEIHVELIGNIENNTTVLAPTLLVEQQAPPSPPPPPPPPPPPKLFSPLGGVKSSSSTSTSRQPRIADVDYDIFVKVVEQHKGQGSHKLTDDDVRKWSNLVKKNDAIRRILSTSKTLEDFDLICQNPQFENEYSREKWALIIQSLAHVAFLKQLNEILDTQQQATSVTNNSHNCSTKILQSNKHKMLNPKSESRSPVHQQQQQQQRLFTRESYCEIKHDMESVVSSTDNNNKQQSSHELLDNLAPDTSREKDDYDYHQLNDADDGVSINKLSNFRERSSSEVLENPPTLSVYLGDVPLRANLHNTNDADTYDNGSNYYYRQGTNSDAASVYGTGR